MKERPTAPRRIVVKIGSGVIADEEGPNRSRISTWAKQIAEIHERSAQAVIVSSGAIACGVHALGLGRRPTDMPTLQAAAAVGQRQLMDLYAAALGRNGISVAQVLLTQYDMVQRRQYVNARNTLERLLQLGVVPIVNENDTVAVEEIRYGDNDLLAALVANLVNADLLIMLSDVEGVLTERPGNLQAELISVIEDPNHFAKRVRGRSSLGSGGMASKLEAARIATLSGVPVVIASGSRRKVISDIWEGRDVGTFFPPQRSRIGARKLWIAWAPVARGKIRIDEGAVNALSLGKKSLLAAGVTVVEGVFKAGDAVEVIGPDGQIVGKGLVNFDADVVAGVAGTKADREVIHRDQLVIL